MKLYSLRNQLVVGVIVSMVVVIVAVGSAVYWALKHESDEIFKARLNTSARVLEALITNQISNMPPDKPIVIDLPSDLGNEHASTNANEQHPYEQKMAFQVWSDVGVLLAKSASAPASQLGELTEGSQSVQVNDESWEVFALRSGSMWVLAAEHNDVLEEKADKLALAVLTPFVAGTLLLILLVNVQVYRGLSPLQQFAQLIRSRNPASLDPVSQDGWPIELRTSVVALNDLLLRVRNAFDREQQFIDAAAHEMRTPVAGIQLHLQNALRTTDDITKHQAITDALSGVRRTTRLIEHMLLLSRTTHASTVAQSNNSFSMLDEVCDEVAHNLSEQLLKRHQQLNLTGSRGIVVRALPPQVNSLCQNLFENASKHGASHADIDVDITDNGTHVTLRVSNDGPTIPTHERESIFRAHYRVSNDEHDHQGFGLGLAIVAQIVNQLNGSIVVTDKTPGFGVIFTVRLPSVADGGEEVDVP